MDDTWKNGKRHGRSYGFGGRSEESNSDHGACKLLTVDISGTAPGTLTIGDLHRFEGSSSATYVQGNTDGVSTYYQHETGTDQVKGCTVTAIQASITSGDPTFSPTNNENPAEVSKGKITFIIKNN